MKPDSKGSANGGLPQQDAKRSHLERPLGHISLKWQPPCSKGVELAGVWWCMHSEGRGIWFKVILVYI